MKSNPPHLILLGGISVFAWLLLAMGVFMIPRAILGAFTTAPTRFSLFGFDYVGPISRPTPIAMLSCFIFFGYTAVALLRERKEGRRLGLVAEYRGATIALRRFCAQSGPRKSHDSARGFLPDAIPHRSGSTASTVGRGADPGTRASGPYLPHLRLRMARTSRSGDEFVM